MTLPWASSSHCKQSYQRIVKRAFCLWCNVKHQTKAVSTYADARTCSVCSKVTPQLVILHSHLKQTISFYEKSCVWFCASSFNSGVLPEEIRGMKSLCFALEHFLPLLYHILEGFNQLKPQEEQGWTCSDIQCEVTPREQTGCHEWGDELSLL